MTTASQPPSSGLPGSDSHHHQEEERRSVVGPSDDNGVRMVIASRNPTTLSSVTRGASQSFPLMNEGVTLRNEVMILPRPSDGVLVDNPSCSSAVLDHHRAGRISYHILNSHQTDKKAGGTNDVHCPVSQGRKVSPFSTSSSPTPGRLITTETRPLISFPALPSRSYSYSIHEGEKNSTVVIDTNFQNARSGNPANTSNLLTVIDDDRTHQHQPTERDQLEFLAGNIGVPTHHSTLRDITSPRGHDTDESHLELAVNGAKGPCTATGAIVSRTTGHCGRRPNHSRIIHDERKNSLPLVRGPIMVFASSGRLHQLKPRAAETLSPSSASLTFQEMMMTTDGTSSSSSSQRKRRRYPSSDLVVSDSRGEDGGRFLQAPSPHSLPDNGTGLGPTGPAGVVDHHATTMRTAPQERESQRRDSVPLDLRNKKMRPTDCLLFAATLLEKRETINHPVPPVSRTTLPSSVITDSIMTPATTTTIAAVYDHRHNDHGDATGPSVQIQSRIGRKDPPSDTNAVPTTESVINSISLQPDVRRPSSLFLLPTPSQGSFASGVEFLSQKIGTAVVAPRDPIVAVAAAAAPATTSIGKDSNVSLVEEKAGTTGGDGVAGAGTVDEGTMAISTSKPRDADVLCGRGGKVNKHKGNIVYRKVVDYNKAFYQSVHKKHRILVSRSIVQSIINYGGRFLVMGNDGRKDTRAKKVWVPICFKRAVQKTSQALRERPTTTAGSDGGGDDNNNKSCDDYGAGENDHEMARLQS